MLRLPPIRLTGATILRDGELRRRSLAIAQGRIAKGPLPAVDLEGYLIMPGIIDLLFHPARGPRAQTRSGAIAARAGITTAWLAPRWSWEDTAGAQAILGQLQAGGAPDLRPALRIESHFTDHPDILAEFCRDARVQIGWFENRLDGLISLGAENPLEFARIARATGSEATRLAEALRAASERRRDVPRHLCRLAECLDTLGARYGSVADSCGSVRETYSMIGARLAAGPTTHSAAAAARAMGDPVLLSAADEGRMRDRMRGRLGDAIISDGAPARMVPLALELAHDGAGDLADIWALMTTRPAEIMGLADRGRLDLGCRADVIVVNQANRAVEATISAGRLIYLAGEAERRFAAAGIGRAAGRDGARFAAE